MSVFFYNPSSYSYNKDITITTNAPTCTYPDLSFYTIGAISPSWSSGTYSINSSTGIITFSGNITYPTSTSGIYTFTIRAKKSDNTTIANTTITLTVYRLYYIPQSYSLTYGNTYSTGSAFLNPSGTLITSGVTYSKFAESQSSSISVNSSSGVITVPATTSISTDTYNVTIKAVFGSSQFFYTVYFLISAATPSNFSYNSLSINYGSSATSSLPVINNGGETVLYSFGGNGTIPSNVSVSNSTGIVSVPSSLSVGTYGLSVAAANSVGSAATTFTVFVNAIPPTNFTYAQSIYNFTFSYTNYTDTPTIDNGGSVITYSIISDSISGITIDSSTGKITISNTTDVGSYIVTVKAQQDSGSYSTQTSITINVNSIGSSMFALEDLNKFSLINNFSFGTFSLPPPEDNAFLNTLKIIPLTTDLPIIFNFPIDPVLQSNINYNDTNIQFELYPQVLTSTVKIIYESQTENIVGNLSKIYYLPDVKDYLFTIEVESQTSLINTYLLTITRLSVTNSPVIGIVTL